MRSKVGLNILIYLIVIVLVVLILGQTSSLVSKLNKKDKDEKEYNEQSSDDNSLSSEVSAVVTKENEVLHETEHGEQKTKKTLYDSYFSPKKILSYSLPFLTVLDIDTDKSIEKSIFTKLNGSDIKTKTILFEDVARIKLEKQGPNFLIYHTHATESFRKVDGDNYEETTSWRTDNSDYNIVGIGERLTEQLEDVHGYSVLHDKTNHEPPKLSTAYSRSVLTMQEYKKDYDNLGVYIDVHRDAANIDKDQDDVVVIDGKRCARVMFVVGTGVNFTNKPEWENNYKIALELSNLLNQMCENFAKPIRVKDGRYNQHISNACILIEVGHNANTYEEAENSVEYIAKAIDAIIEK